MKYWQAIKLPSREFKRLTATLKTQVVLGEQTGKIICLAHDKGKTHDFKLFKKL